MNLIWLSAINVRLLSKVFTFTLISFSVYFIGLKPNFNKFSIPLCEEAAFSNKKVVELAPLAFENMQLRAPKFVPIEEPSYYKDCGPQLDQKLLTPFQRREILEFEKKKYAADAYIRQAISDRSKLKDKLIGPEYKRGVIGYDNATNPESEIYGAKAKAYIDKVEEQNKIQANRTKYIAQKTSSMEYSGNILNPDLMSDNVKTQKYYQNKGGSIHAFTFEETYYRVLESNKEVVKHNPSRTQYLRNQDLNGKNYNIVSHVPIESWPSNSSERVNHRMMHPSQTSLHGVRNMQGSLKPY
jgi:hypothetical protein